ncbi:sensor histidine kinase [Marinomonas communis]|uniref:sensor histidine kinase n=1 Tax=Marinomonas communis TaxID=28254 RepID=UPI0010048692|nr:ATP-binding protein [Marinomonas communis]MCC4274595.1 ATP-binding protein [Marinomonas communis]MEC8080925.1 ATP-binding protein [Pseudomonadota bacterium]RUM57537.1 MAG: PAS domain-containing sensor histidine kinase [Marinomonas sp.]
MDKDQEIARLKEAFVLFEETSRSLQASYDDLQMQVRQLTAKLERAEQAKREEESKNKVLLKQFQQLFQSMPVGVMLLNPEGRVVMTNPIVDRLFGESILGGQWADIVPKSFRPQKDDGHEITMVTGRRVRVETSSLGDVPGQLIILVDLTETHSLQRQLAHHERLSTMGKMVAALAHQIRTPLSSAMLYAGHLQKESLSEDMRQRFSGKLSDRLNNIERQIRDMLIFSKSDIKLDEKVSVSELLNKIAERAQEQADQNHALLKQDLCVSNDGLIQCHQEVLIGAVLNLINNAIEASERGASVEIVALSQDALLSIAIKDSGRGMDEEQLRKVQEGFVTTKQHGTGLGLMVVKAIMRAHHGTFNIESQPGVGTKATIKLPILGS